MPVLSAAIVGATLAILFAGAGPPRYRSTVQIEVTDAAGLTGQRAPVFEALTGSGGDRAVSTAMLRDVVTRQDLARLVDVPSGSGTWFGARVDRLKHLTLEAVETLTGKALPEARDRVPDGTADGTVDGAVDGAVDGTADGTVDGAPTELALIQALRNATATRIAEDLSIVEMTVTAGTPETAQRLAAALGDAFIAERDRAQKARLAEDARRHAQRAAELQSGVAGAEEALANYLEENDLETLETRSTQIDLRAANLNFEAVRLEADHASLQSARDRIRTAVADGLDLGALPEIQGSDLAASLRADRLSLQRALREARRGNGTEAEISALERQIADIDGDIADEARRILASLDSQLSEIAARERQVQDGLNGLVAEAKEIEAARLGADALQRQLEASREAHMTFLSTRDSTRDPTAGTRTGFVSDAWVVQPASRPTQPVEDPLPAIALVGGLAGALVCMVLVAFRERLVRGFVAAGQVEAVLRLPVLVSLPRAGTRARRWGRKPWDGGSELPDSVVEDLRGLRHLLTENLGARSAPVVLLTSAGAEEGRTGFAMTLAKSANRDGRNVLLVDADPGTAGLSKALDCEQDDGLTELVEAGRWDLQGNTPGSGVMDVLPAGRVLDAPLRFIESDAFARFLDDARNHYDLILIDGPSHMASLETRVLAGLSDATCLVVRWNHSPRRAIADAVARLGREMFLGVALTDVDMRKSALYRATYPHRPGRVAAKWAAPDRRAALPNPASFARLSGHA